jgi:2'-5' RNA ligase
VSMLCSLIAPQEAVFICSSDPGLLKYSYGCVMLDIDPQSEAGQQIRALRDEIPDEELMAKGREMESHVTVRYGIQDTASEAGIAAYLTTQPPFRITIGKTIVFPPTANSDNAAVVVLQVESAELGLINYELEEAGNFKTADFEYHPHITLAYVVPEAAEKWAGDDSLEGVELEVREIIIRSKDGSAIPVALAGITTPVVNQTVGAEKIVARGARFTCPKCGRYLSPGSQTCENQDCSPGTGNPEVSTQGIESTPDETSATTRPGNLPAPASIGVKATLDPVVIDNPESGANNVGVSGKDNAMAAAADRSENPYGVGVETELAVKGTLLCAAVFEDDDEDEDPDDPLLKLHGRLLCAVEKGWVTIDGAHVFIDEHGVITKGPAALVGQTHHGPIVAMTKAEIAKATYSGGLKVHQDLGDKTAKEVGEALGIPVTSNNKAFDVENKKYGIEVKTLITQKNDKITMNTYARSLKTIRQKEAGLKAFTIVVDKRPSGLGTSTGATRYFVKSGFGSFNISAMREVKSLAAAKSFMQRTPQ